MEVHSTIRSRVQWSAFDRRRIGVWGIRRGLFCGGRGNRTRSLARFTWRVYQVRSDLIYGRRTTGDCSRSWTRAIRVWAVDLAVHRIMHTSLSAAPLKLAFNIDRKELATAY